ncbi:antigen 5 like allergen Cul n 1-like [Anopheles cruzii]|uniref:antigen 5 like allergen Cul n 1-like n=1 Tax=Anopheles cruzii TaxID=68878 RepID=UPI0022EC9595|nr:antigen 5 like allergen Cul n 1-like [Anopheles cruzii]
MARWIFATLAMVFLGALDAQDLCSLKSCGTSQNVGCNPPPQTGGPACAGKSASVITMDATLKNLILDRHNTLRAQLASGNLAGFKAAVRMPTLVWDESLASQAGNNARSCNYAHDACRNTATYAWAGQNLAMKKYYGMTFTNQDLAKSAIDSWWGEYNVTSQAQTDSYPSGSVSPAIGHFTQMASDRTSTIGCAMQKWLDGQYTSIYTVCDYSVTNVVSTAVYKTGTSASQCTNKSTQYSGLCAVGENVPATPN